MLHDPAAFAELIAKRLEELYRENLELKKQVKELEQENQLLHKALSDNKTDHPGDGIIW